MSAPSRATADPADRWTALGVLASALLLAMTTWFSGTAVLPQLSVLFELSPAARSWVTIAVQLGFVVGALTSAICGLADRIGPRRLMLMGAVGASATNAVILFADGAASLLSLRFLTGAFLAGVYPPAMKAMATWFRAGRGVALGVMVAALTLGSATPHLVNGLGGLDWQIVIVATSLLTISGGLLAELAGRDGPFPFSRVNFSPRQAVQAFRKRSVLLASLGYFGHMWELYAMWAWIGVFLNGAFLVQDGPHAARDAALWSFGVIGVGAAGCALAGVLGDRWGRIRSTVLMMGLSGLCALAVGWLQAGPMWLLLAVALIWGFAIVADSAQFSAVVTEVADQAYVGTALTLQLAFGFTLTVATIWLIPVLVEHVGWPAGFGVLAIGPGVGIVSMLALRRSDDVALIAGGRG